MNGLGRQGSGTSGYSRPIVLKKLGAVAIARVSEVIDPCCLSFVAPTRFCEVKF